MYIQENSLYYLENKKKKYPFIGTYEIILENHMHRNIDGDKARIYQTDVYISLTIAEKTHIDINACEEYDLVLDNQKFLVILKQIKNHKYIFLVLRQLTENNLYQRILI